MPDGDRPDIAREFAVGKMVTMSSMSRSTPIQACRDSALSKQADILSIADHCIEKRSDGSSDHDGMKFCRGSHSSHPCHNGW